MNDVVVIAYPDLDTADQAHDILLAAMREPGTCVGDVVLAERTSGGEVKVRSAHRCAAREIAKGALVGGLGSLLVFAPVAGIALAAAGGAVAAAGGAAGVAAWGAWIGSIIGEANAFGVEDRVNLDWAKDLEGHLPAGEVAVCVMVKDTDTQPDRTDRMLGRVSHLGGRVVRTTISEEETARLEDELKKGEE